MHVRELVELAALLSGHAELLVGSRNQLTSDGISDYWSTSKARIDRWSRSLHSLSDCTQQARSSDIGFVHSVVEPLLHEVFASEVLTRVWAAVVSLCDERLEQQAATSVARSVLVSHQEVRCSALQWLVNGPLSGTPDADAVNLVRRRCERWTDLLIANLCHLGNVAEFTFDIMRAGEFARDFADERRAGTYAAGWSMTMTSLRAALRVGLTRECHSRDANQRIASAVLACFGAGLFNSTGSLRSVWLDRLQKISADTEGMLSELLSLESQPTTWEFPRTG